MSERFSVSVPPVANDICRSAVPAPKYLPERRSTAFPHHYTLAHLVSETLVSGCRPTCPGVNSRVPGSTGPGHNVWIIALKMMNVPLVSLGLRLELAVKMRCSQRWTFLAWTHGPRPGLLDLNRSQFRSRTLGPLYTTAL